MWTEVARGVLKSYVGVDYDRRAENGVGDGVQGPSRKGSHCERYEGSGD